MTDETDQETRHRPEEAREYGAQSGGCLEGDAGYGSGNLDEPEQNNENGGSNADGYRGARVELTQ